MPRYIDADALKYKIEQHSYPLSDRINSIENGMFLCGIYQAIDESATADVVPVVRCKDCKHYQTDILFNSNYCCGRRRKPDDYCSYGERRESEVTP